MAFPFVRVEQHRKFENTFLLRAILKVSYKLPEGDCYDQFSEFFEKALGINVSRERFDQIRENALALDSEDDLIHWLFDGESITRVVEYPAYEDYGASMEPSVANIAVLLDQLHACVESVTLRKINLFAFNGDTAEDAGRLAHFIFRYDFIDKVWNSHEYTKDNASLMKSQEFTDETSGDRVRIVTGYILERNNAPEAETRSVQPSRLVLECSATGCHGTDDINTVARRLNAAVYDAFVWSVDEPVFKVMEGKANV